MKTLLLLFAVLVFAACGEAGPDYSGAIDSDAIEGAAFVTLLGDDTLAVETFQRTAAGMEAAVVLRTPRTTVYRYRLDLDEGGALRRYEATSYAPDATPATAPRRRDVVTPQGDSLLLTISEGDSTTMRLLAADASALPFIDMIHWPFELMLARAVGVDSLTQPLFTARNTMPFVVRRHDDGTMTVTHPFRGTMNVEVDAEGRLLRLDAGATTRKLVVTRVPEVDLDALAQDFAARDAAGRAFGPLSGRGETLAQIDGATLSLDYGQPAKRGRVIFGALVPWGEVWRTGANRATHLETDRALSLGGLDVPAGTYTLYTIPESDGGTLIVNRQTGQGGTTYDPERDLGRVPMRLETLPEPVEVFTIDLEDTDAGGLLKLMWDQTAFIVPFTVKN